MIEAGCAMKAIDAASLLYKLQLLIDDPARLAQMRARREVNQHWSNSSEVHIAKESRSFDSGKIKGFLCR